MPTTTCEHEDKTLTWAALDLLSEAERAALNERLATCETCRKRLADYQALVSCLGQLVPARERAFTAADEVDGAAATQSRRVLDWRERYGGSSLDAESRGSGLRRHRRAGAAGLPPAAADRRSITMVGALAALLLVALLLGTFWSFGPGRGHHGTLPQPASSGSHLPAVDPALGAAPVACAGAPAPQSGVQGISGAIGGPPFWVGGFVGTHAALLAGGSSPSPYGWYAKVVTRVDAAFTGALTLRGTNLLNDTALWFQLGGVITTAYSLSGSAGTSDAGYIFIPSAGCYTLTASWGTQSWSYTFAAGSALPAAVGALPAACPNQPAPSPLATNLPGVIGRLPLWLTANGSRAAYHLDLSGNGVPLTFFVSNTFTHTVSIRGKDLKTGRPVGFVAPPNPPATILALNNSYVRSSGPYTEWPASAYFPEAGCYALTATWPGGSWTFDVAAGA